MKAELCHTDEMAIQVEITKSTLELRFTTFLNKLLALVFCPITVPLTDIQLPLLSYEDYKWRWGLRVGTSTLEYSPARHDTLDCGGIMSLSTRTTGPPETSALR